LKPLRVREESQIGSSELDFIFRLRQSELQAAEQKRSLNIFCRLTLIRDLLNYPTCQLESAGLIVSNTLLLLFCAGFDWSRVNFPA
jgi:hypothetical protein